MKFKNGRQVFIVNNRNGMFYPVQDIIIDMLKYWNKSFINGLDRWNESNPEPLFDLNDEADWQYAGERLAVEMGADQVLITDSVGDLINTFDKLKRSRRL